jgi:hypothetical protein
MKYLFSGSVYVAGDPTHLWLFSPRQMVSLLRRTGFRVLCREAGHFGCGDEKGGKIPGLPVYFDRLQASARWPLNRLGFNLLFVCEKKGE